MAKSNTTSAAAAEPSGLATGIQVSGGSRGTSDIATEPLHVTLERSSLPGTDDQALWIAIRNRTDAVGFDAYAAFLKRLLCERQGAGSAACGGNADDGDALGSFGTPSLDGRLKELAARPSIYGTDAYHLLKLATEAFVIAEGGVVILPPRVQPDGAAPVRDDDEMPGEASRLGQPVLYGEAKAQLDQYLRGQIGSVSERGLRYLKRIVDALIPAPQRSQGLPFCDGVLRHRLSCPSMIELIWCYWQERGYLVQTMNAIGLRFQNSRRGPDDPLVNLAIDPLRGLANLLWGFVQDRERLTVARRALEYQYAYGLPLDGKAVATLQPVESRTRFLDTFHNLLHCVGDFYEAEAFTTVRPDGFKLLQALKELHLELAESLNNQAEELKRTARVEMMVMQYLLSREEMAQFLRGRAMVPYRESWMGQVDTMKRLQRWTSTSVTHFRDLADSAEKLLLSVRYGDWVDVNDQAQALNWARYFKPEAQAYMHAYRAVTGVDLTARRVDVQRRPAMPLPHAAGFTVVDEIDAGTVPVYQRS